MMDLKLVTSIFIYFTKRIADTIFEQDAIYYCCLYFLFFLMYAWFTLLCHNMHAISINIR